MYCPCSLLHPLTIHSGAAHSVSLAHTVYDDGALLHALKLGDALVLAYIINVFVDFICENKQILVAFDDVGQSFQLGFVIHTAGRVAGRTEDDQTRLRCDGFLQLLGSHLEVLLETGFHYYGVTACQQHHLRVAHPIGGRDNHLVAWVNQCHHRVAHALLGTVRHQNLGRLVVQVVLALQFAGYSLTEVGIAGNG